MLCALLLCYIIFLLIGSVIPACLLGVYYCRAWCCVCSLTAWCLLLLQSVLYICYMPFNSLVLACSFVAF